MIFAAMPKKCARLCHATRSVADQSDERLVDERRRLKGVIAAFPPKIGAGAAPELAIDERHQVVARLYIPASPRPKQPGYGAAVICLTH